MLPITTRTPAGRLALLLLLALALAFSLMLALALPANAGGVTLRWTAPGDDGAIGRATAYDVRWSLQPIDEAGFATATPVAGPPAPQLAGAAESLRVEGLADGALVYFAVRTRDERWNWGPMSNLASARVGGIAGVDGAPAAALLGAPVPNPARSRVRFALGPHPFGALAVTVFDAAGRWVRTLAAAGDGGTATLAWDLTDAAGRRVPAGCYLVRAAAGGRAVVRRVSVVP